MTKYWNPVLEKSDQPLYRTIIKALSDDISSGKLTPGTRLPTHRELADQLKVAIGTITRAYSEAELRGLIHSEGRRGTFVGTVRNDKASFSSLIEMDSRVIDLSKNHPNYEVDPDLSITLKQIARKSDTQKLLHYSSSAGEYYHRETACKWLASMGGDFDPDSILITAGAQHALLILLPSLAEHGDIILTEEFTYPGIKAVADMFGLLTIGVPMDEHGILPDELESVCRKRKVRALYCNPTLQNPTNILFSQSRRQKIAEIAETYDFVVIEDDILRPLVKDAPDMISKLIPDRCFFILSTSKVLAAGLRVGFIAVPPYAKQNVVNNLRTTLLALPQLTIEIFSQWYEAGIVEQIIEKRRSELKQRQILAEKILGDFIQNLNPTSYHIWLRLPNELTPMQYALEAHRRGVAVAPSELFAADKRTDCRAVRVSIATAPNLKVLESGLRTLAEILEEPPSHRSVTI